VTHDPAYARAVEDRLRVPAEQLFWACSCGHYESKTPGSQSGARAHQRKARCGGSLQAVLPEDLVLSEEMEPQQAWAAAEPAPTPSNGHRPPVAEQVTEVAEPVPPRPGPVAAGRVVPPTDPDGPTQFRGLGAAPAGLYAVYDAFRVQKGYEGTFDAWLVECTELFVQEVLGVELVLTARFPEPAGAV
jgi:hypothetical protein